MASIDRPLFLAAAALLGVTSLAASAGSGARDEAPRLAPAEGLELRRALTRSMAMESTTIERFQNGESSPIDDTLEVTQDTKIEVLDRFTVVEEGSVRSLERTITSVESQVSESSAAGDRERDRETELEGETVVFEWDDEAWSVRPGEDSELDAELVEGLLFDMDYAMLLPEAEVDEGATWEIDVELARALLNPIGEVPYEESDENAELDAATDEAMDDLWTNVEGTVEVTYGGREESAEGHFALFSVALDFAGEGRSAEELEEVDGERFITVVQAVEATAELRWDLDGGHLSRLDMEGELALERTTGVELTAPDGSLFEGGMRIALAGTFAVSVATGEDPDGDDE